MRVSPAKILILVALFLVVLVEARTVLAFFDIDVSWTVVAGFGVVAIAVFLVWAIRPVGDDSPDS